jgi:Mg2+-importing ATPase
LARLGSQTDGLTVEEAERRRAHYGPNRVRGAQQHSALRDLWRHVRSPLNGLLAVLAITSWALSDARSAILIMIMVLLSVGLSFVQERRSTAAAAKLAEMVRVQTEVLRRGAGGDAEGWCEIDLDEVVPGDIVKLAAGAIIPADLRLIEAHDLFADESALTGESLPAEKSAASAPGAAEPSEAANLCFMGSHVTSGYGRGVVMRTGRATLFGDLVERISGAEVETSFDKGLRQFVWLMVRFIALMGPAVFLINGLGKHDWLAALTFAVAVAVGLTPEMLPMIVTVNLARGAVAMSRRRAIVKDLKAIQNFGAMDVLCTDKTGTLTQNRIILKLHVDVTGHEDLRVLHAAYLNSRFQSGLPNLMDVAVLQHADLDGASLAAPDYRKVDELPFDFTRRRLSVVVQKDGQPPLMICKGAVEEVVAVCTRYQLGDAVAPLDPQHLPRIQAVTDRLNGDGFRVLAVATRAIARGSVVTVADEADLTLLGFVAFLDPPKDSAAGAIAALTAAGVQVKILTGDNGLVARKVCREVGLEVGDMLLGHQVAAMDDRALAAAAQEVQVFAKTAPAEKARIIAALRSRGRVVGYLGDGINDGPALRAADVGISVDSAVDVAKATAAIILLEKDLSVLADGVREGRRVFGNIVKYIRMGASSNFGNMFSMLGGSLLLPFLPMAPLQVLTNNLLYDLSQTAIPTDNVDPEYLARPRRWEMGGVARFMLLVGPVSSVFDFATFAVMWWVFGAGRDPALFQTGWFVESLLTQTLIIHIIRTTKIPFVESRASTPLLVTSLAVGLAACALPASPLAPALGMKPLPGLYWPIVAALLLGYAALAHVAMRFVVRRSGL